MLSRLNVYYQLTKPGVLYGNVLTAVAGYFFAAAHFSLFDPIVFFGMLVGQTLVIASACVANNYLDQDIDSKMKRTKKRPSVTGQVSDRNMKLYTTFLGTTGFVVLWWLTNPLVFFIGLVGWITYVWLYGALSKRRSIHGTLVGSISGAMPIAGGYAAVTGLVDPALIIVFLILFFWQFPEFYSIAIYRRKEYKAAGVPVMTVIKGNDNTIIQIFIYTILYVISTLSLTLLGYTGWVYFAVMLLSGVYWLVLAAKGFSVSNKEKWARKMFTFSMVAILLLCVMLSVGPLLP